MNDLLTSREFLIGLATAAIPLLVIFLAWVSRSQLGLFRRKVRWSVVSQFSDGASLTVDGRSNRTSWTYLLLSISPGAEAVRDLKIYVSRKVATFSISPKTPDAKIENQADDKSTISISRIEAGNYQILLVSEDSSWLFSPISGVTADNAKCVEKSAPKASIKSMWSNVPNWLAWLVVWSLVIQTVPAWFTK